MTKLSLTKSILDRWDGMLRAWSSALSRKDFAAIADWFNLWFFGIGAAGLTLAAGADKGHWPRILALGVLLAGASGVSGWLFGLLFGIPRSLARGGQATTAPLPGTIQTSKVNTNLEDISDWLTKTLIGVSLTQLNTFPGFLWGMALTANAYGFAWTDMGPKGVVLHQPGALLAETIIVYFTAGGFWLGYVGTRTILTRLFDSIDGGISQTDVDTAKSAMNLKIAEVELGTDGILKSGPALAISDLKLLAMPIQSLGSSADVVAWAAAQARARHFEAAQVALEGALGTDPDNADIQRVLATVYAATDKFDLANDLLRSLPATRTTLFCALYDRPPTGFERAIAVGTALIADAANADDVDIRVWLACAYGQKYAFELSRGAPDAGVLSDTKAKVVENIKVAIHIDPAARETLYAFWKPTKYPEENDLQAIPADDPDLKSLLESN